VGIIEYRIGSLKSSEKRTTDYMIESRLLSEYWFKTMREKTQVLWDIKKIHDPWKAAHENHKTLLFFIENHEEDLNKANELYLVDEKAQDSMIKIIQLVTNCIVSSTTFLTIVEIYIREKNDLDKSIKDDWNKKRQELHKSNFYYRLAYDLRNYSQHYGIPISGIAFTMDGDSVKKIEAFLLVADLISGRFKWNKNLLSELQQARNSEFDILNVLTEYLQCIDEIYRNTIELHCQSIRDCEDYFNELCMKHDIDEDSHPVVFKGKILPGENIPREKEFIPLYVLRKIKKDWHQILKFKGPEA
jgi:hypothetical protein